MTLKEELRKYRPMLNQKLFTQGFEVIVYKRTGEDKWQAFAKEFNTIEEATAAVEHAECRFIIIDRIIRYYNHREKIKRDVVPEMWMNSVESIKKLGICLNKLEPLTDIAKIEMAGYLQKIIPIMKEIKPGKRSRFYDSSTQLIEELEEWMNNVLQTETETV
jgi:hypothetical protein